MSCRTNPCPLQKQCHHWAALRYFPLFNVLVNSNGTMQCILRINAKVSGSQGWARTNASGSKVRCATTTQPGNIQKEPYSVLMYYTIGSFNNIWLRGPDSNRQPPGYEPGNLPLIYPAMWCPLRSLTGIIIFLRISKA